MFQTVDVEYNVKVVNIPDTDVQVELYLYDCAGQPIFNTQNSKGQFPNQKHVSFILLRDFFALTEVYVTLCVYFVSAKIISLL